ncbi:hypothetical protein, partial [Hydrogenophaga sp.]|uniref:hypothetical protein n=1 Tax=Hydrogenophaga sp. TaxID=1904254 RepID=UPI003568D55D
KPLTAAVFLQGHATATAETSASARCVLRLMVDVFADHERSSLTLRHRPCPSAQTVPALLDHVRLFFAHQDD